MARNKGYLVPGTVKTLDDRDKYPVVDVNDIAGARHIVQSDNARLNIPKLRRKVGMECLVVDTNTLDGSVAFRLYKLKNNPNTEATTASDWEEMADLTAAEIANFITDSNLTTKLSNYVQKSDLPNITDYLKTADAETTYAKKDEVYSKTDADSTFAKKADLPEFDKIVVDVVTPDVLNVAFNTDINTANVLPTQVDVTYEDGTSGKVDVNWNTTTYDKEKSELQVVLGTLDLSTGTKNAIVTAVQHIIVGADIHILDEIVSTNPVVLTDLYNTPFDNLELPEKMKVKYTDGTTGFLNIDWSAASSVYNPQSLTEQTLVGEFILTEKDKQPVVPIDPPSAKVTLFQQKKIVSQAAINDVSVLQETAFADAGFPTKNTVTLDDGSTVELDIVWNKGSYNPLTVSHQSLTGEYVLPKNITNEDDITPIIAFEVCAKPDICDAEDPTMAPVNLGVSINDLPLPASTNVTILPHDYDGVNVLMTQGTANINWDLTETDYDPTTPGDYYITGELVPPAGVTNKTNITVEVKVTVLAATGPSYWVKNVPIINHADLANGSKIIDVVEPATVDITIGTNSGPDFTDTATVVWTPDPTFDGSPATETTYVWTGVITPSDPSYVVNGKKAQMYVKVLAPVVETYTLVSIDDPVGSATVTEGDTFADQDALEAALGLPTQVQVTVLKAPDNTQTQYTADISVWNLTNIDNDGDSVIDNVASLSQPIKVYGTILPTSMIPGVSVNTNGLAVEFNVTVNAKPVVPATRRTIKSVSTTINPIDVEFGSNVNDVKTELNTNFPTVDIVIDDPTNGDTPMTGVAVTWEIPSTADNTQANSTWYAIGTLDTASLEALADPVYDDNNISPIKVAVNVGAAPVVKTIDSYAIKGPNTSFTVENGTAEADIPFTENTLDIVVANCLVNGNAETHDLAVTAWQPVTTYDGTTAGNYDFTPVFDNSSLTTNGYTGNPTIPIVKVTVKAAESTDPSAPDPDVYGPSAPVSALTNKIGMSEFSDECFLKLVALGDNLETAWMGEFDENDEDEHVDPDTRSVDIRYMGTPVYNIPGGIRIPASFADELETPETYTAYQAKLAELGIPDGTFGTDGAPVTIVSINIIPPASNSAADIASAKTASDIQFSAPIQNAIFTIRIAKPGYVIKASAGPNAY